MSSERRSRVVIGSTDSLEHKTWQDCSLKEYNEVLDQLLSLMELPVEGHKVARLSS